MFTVANSVERSQSPAFQLFDDVYKLRHKAFVEERETTAGFIFVEENEPTSGLVFGEKGQYYVWKWNIETLREWLEDMPLKLWALFTRNWASIHDRDEYGKTLLHVSTMFPCYRFTPY